MQRNFFLSKPVRTLRFDFKKANKFSIRRIAHLLPANTRISGVPVWISPGLMATQAADKPWERGCAKISTEIRTLNLSKKLLVLIKKIPVLTIAIFRLISLKVLGKVMEKSLNFFGL